jgi:dTDP-glucose pyrophosphorylase
MLGRDVSQLFIGPDSTVADAIAAIDRGGRVSMALVVDKQRRIINTLTDGDVRRGLLAGLGLDAPVSKLFEIKARTPYPEPITARVGTDIATLMQIFQDRCIRQLPLLNKRGAVVDIVIWSDFQRLAEQPFRALVMAGGKGARLRPLTDSMPKPMLPVGGRPVLERIVEQLRGVGVRRIHVATHYQADKIVEHFGDGESFGVDIQYVKEETPLGTGGALGLMDTPDEPVLVINGDILTQVDFRSMFAFHQDQRAEMTVAVRRYDMQVPYGVVECDGVNIRALREKPQLSFFVNAGIYLLEPSVFALVQPQERMDITDLVSRLMAAGRPVVSYPICEYWLDMGQHQDYQKAQEDAVGGKLHRYVDEEYTYLAT